MAQAPQLSDPPAIAAAPPPTPLSLTIGQRRVAAVAPRTKAFRLISLAATSPREFYDRLRAIYEVRARKRHPTTTRYLPTPWQELERQLSDTLRTPVSWSNSDPGFAHVAQRLRHRAADLGDIPFPAAFDGDPCLARLGYFLTLALRPQVVVETGVAFGVVSSFILAALAKNDHGRLISIDLPPLGVGFDHIGQLVPDDLRSRWTLLRGASTRTLPRILSGLPPVGLFIHDSLFTSRNSRAEYGLIVPRLAPQSAIVANRVDFSDAFAALAAHTRPAISAVIAAEAKQSEMLGRLYRIERNGESGKYGRCEQALPFVAGRVADADAMVTVVSARAAWPELLHAMAVTR